MFTANLSDEHYVMSSQAHSREHHTRVSSHFNNGGSKGVQFCEQIPNHPSRLLKEAVEEKGNVAEIEERLKRKDYEQFPPKDEFVSHATLHKSLSSCREAQKAPYRQTKGRCESLSSSSKCGRSRTSRWPITSRTRRSQRRPLAA